MARYGLVVGVASYKKPLGNLSKTESDAKAVNDLLKPHGDFEDIQVLVGDVTREKLEDALGRLLTERADRNEALIYFSGHAVVVKGNFNKKRGYLALSNTVLKTSNGEITGIENGIALDDLSGLIGEAKLSNLVLLLDCCHSETLLEESQGFLQRAIVSQAFAELKQDYFLVSACRKFEEAYAMKSESYSIFTGAMLRGLARDRANDRGVVDASSMFGYVAEQLRGTGQEAVSFGYGRALRIVDYRAKSEVAEICPYVGLNAFDKSTMQWFFGREKAFDRLLSKLPFVFVVGVSGSGKSSLVKAKLIPEMEKRGYRSLLMKPWTNPIQNLKTALTSELEGMGADVVEIENRIDREGLLAAIADLPMKPILLVIDQFEEIFTVCPSEVDRRKFMQMLVDVAQAKMADFAIAATMRVDFLAECSHANLEAIVNEQMVIISGLNEDELKEAIAKPADTQRYQIEDGLLDAILQDIDAEPNCLPLLEFALQELWGNRDRQKRLLTRDGYRQMDRLKGALNRHADRLYDEQSERGKVWMRRIFLKLVRTGKDTKDTRQRERRSELVNLAGEDATGRKEIEQVLRCLEGKRGRLLVASVENGIATVDLAHEVLMDGWQRFRDWRSQDRDLRRLGDRVKDAFEEWNKALDRDKFLLPEGVVAQIEEVEVAVNDYLTPEQQEFVKRSLYKYKPWLDKSNLPEMVDIPSGTFWMGSPEGIGNDDEKPYHQVTVTDFQMGKYPVTQAQWRTVAMSPKVEIDLSLNPSYHRGEDKPVEQITWYEAQEFCARLSQLTGENYRLPSEAEWEYACRAGTSEYTEYCFGDDPNQLDDYGWYGNNSGDRIIDADRIWKEVNQDASQYTQRLRLNNCGTHPVGQKLPNAWGLYDLHGNVWEWCADDWHDDYEGAPTDAQIWTKDIKNYEEAEMKVLRGGSWGNIARYCRSASRIRNLASILSYIIGFRVIFASSS